MNLDEKITHEIIELTQQLELEYPALYKNLEETPVKKIDMDELKVNTNNLIEYLETLKLQIQHHKATHKKMEDIKKHL
jgi:hypothetical protein